MAERSIAQDKQECNCTYYDKMLERLRISRFPRDQVARAILLGSNARANDILRIAGFSGVDRGNMMASAEDVARFYGVNYDYMIGCVRRYFGNPSTMWSELRRLKKARSIR